MSSASILQDGENRALSNSGSFYSGTGKKNQKNGLFKTKKGRNGFIVVLFMLGGIGVGTAFLGTSNVSLIGALPSLITEQLDPQYTNNHKVMEYTMTRVLRGEAKLSKSLKQKLEANDFTIKEDGKKITLTYKDGTVVDGDNLAKTLNSNVELRGAYNQSVQTKSLGFYDKSAVKNKKRYNITNNKLKSYVESGDYDENKTKMTEILAPDYESVNTEVGATTTKQEEVVDEDGNVSYKETSEINDPAKSNKVESGSEVGEAATKSARSYVSKVANTAGSVANGVCTVLRVGSMISAAVAGYEAVHSMMYAMNYLEPFSKAQAGDGDTSGINVALNDIATPATEKITDISKVNSNNSSSETDSVIELTGSATEAPSFLSIMGKKAPVMSDSLQKSLSLDKVLLGAFGAIGFSKAQYSMCEGVSVIQSVVSITLSGGISALIASTFLSTVVGTVINTAVGAAIGFAIPIVAKVICSNMFTTTRGILTGENIISGATETAAMIGRTSSGQVLATEETALAYNKITQEIIAQDAEVERYTHSPFDISSQYTFLGSIAYNLFPIIISTRKNTLSNISNVVNKSVANITGTSTYADSTKNSSYLTTFGKYCELNNAIGATCTITGRDIVASDPSTFKLDVSKGSQAYNTYIKPNLNESGDKIKEGSDLAKFINYVVLRESKFGYADASISAEEDIVTGSLANNDFAAIVNGVHNLTDKDVKAWIYGDYGVMCSDRWGQFKVFSRWISQQRINEWLDIEQDTVLVYNDYVDQRIAKVTADDSFAGILSRISGLSKSDAEFVIALGEYYKYLDTYDPSSVIALDKSTAIPTSDEMIAKANQDKLLHQNNRIKTTIATLINSISYADLRNRNYLV